MDRLIPPYRNSIISDEVQRQFDVSFSAMIEKHRIASKDLDEKQLAEVIIQALACGDIQKLISTDGKQSIVYLPFREVERLKGRIQNLEQIIEKVKEALKQ